MSRMGVGTTRPDPSPPTRSPGGPRRPPRHAHRIRGALHGVVIDDFRADVEGLRAVAVVLVLLFHANLLSFTGGFVGVDVFFVVSGFLITRLLLKEMATHGTISLPAFWSRRARRLLPAATLTLVVTLVFSWWILPPLRHQAVILDGLAVSAFVANFRFAHTLGDYFGAQLGALTPSPLLHYWSLAVEEQFYLVWPATMLLVSSRPRQFRRLLTTVIVAAALASLLVSIWLTDRNPTAAFYLLPARIVELLAGAALAVAGPAVTRWSARRRGYAGWVGLFAIAVAAIFYDQSVAFPGIAVLLPVLGTVAVIVAGTAPASPDGPQRILELPWLQWIGKHSYAIYLWHWPVLVLAEAQRGPLSVAERLVALAVAVALSAVSVQVVENPVRFSTRLARPPRRGLALGAGLIAGSLLVGAWMWAIWPDLAGGGQATHVTLDAEGADGNTPDASADGSLAGGGGTAPDATTPVGQAATPGRGTAGGAQVDTSRRDLAGLTASMQQILTTALGTTEVPSNLRPPLRKAFDDKSRLYPDNCVNVGVEAHVRDCRYGVRGAPKKFVLYGDSHAAQWFSAVEAIATEQHAELIVLTKGGCPTADVRIKTATLGRTCPAWRTEAMSVIARAKPALVLVTASSHYDNPDAEWRSGLQATLQRIAPNTKDLVVLSDSPGGADVPADCLSRHLTSVTACNNRRQRATAPGRVAADAAAAAAVGARHIDPTDWLCAPTACPVIVGDVLLYRDVDHLTVEAADLLMPLLRAALFPAGS